MTKIASLFALISFSMLFVSAQTVSAATITVNSLSDAVAGDGQCTLREAITNANADNQSGSVDCAAGAGADTISISVPGTIDLLSALPQLASDVTINGLGASQTTVRRDSAAAAEFAIFVKTSGTGAFSDMTVSDGIVRGWNADSGGEASGGGIFNGGALTLTNVVITNNRTIGGNGSVAVGGLATGAGISSIGQLTIINSTISGNFATGGNGSPFGPFGAGGRGLGGAIYCSAALTITNSTLSGNSATGGNGDTGGEGSGGAIYINSADNQTITNSVISGNTVTGGMGTTNGAFAFGGGISAIGDFALNLTVNNSSVINNSAVGGNGTASGQGGGINSNLRTVLYLNNSTVSGNTSSGVGVGGAGGGIIINGTAAAITGSTISNNTATRPTNNGGGIINVSAALNVTNSTISGNVCSGNGSGNGGGIRNTGTGTTTLNNVTITDNSALGTNSASGVLRADGTVNSKNTIIAGNVNNGSLPDVFNITSGTNGLGFVSQGYNLIGNVGAEASVFSQTGDQTGTSAAPLNPMLAALANNGGATQTHRPLTGSPAIDKGAAAIDPITTTAITTDQRGVPRPFDFPAIPNAPSGNGTDIGAYEALPQPTVTSVNPSFGTTAGGTSVTITGTNLTGAAPVTFGGTACVVVSNTATQIVCMTGARSAGLVDVAVTTPGGVGTGIGLYTYVTPPPGSVPMNFVVDTTVDNVTLNACTAVAGDCSLRGAIANANANSGDDTITFDPGVFAAAQTISLAADGELALANNGTLTITGTGANLLTVQRSTAGGTPDFRIFYVNPNVTASISGLTISNGKVSGSFPRQGGGIFNDGGMLWLTGVTVSGNSVTNAGSGGGICNCNDGGGGTLTISNSTISGNSATGGNSSGGGISSVGQLLVSNSIVTGNTAGGGTQNNGGGIASVGTATIANSTISGNSVFNGVSSIAPDSRGGGIQNFGTMTLTDSTVSTNSAYSLSSNVTYTYGGGINNQGVLTITNSTLSGNLAKDASVNRGGGIYNSGSSLTIANSTLSGNAAMGGIGNQGGGIKNEAPLTITNSTITGNSAINGGGIDAAGDLVNLRSSIIAGNSATNVGPDYSGNVTSQGYNLIGNNADATITASPGTADQIGGGPNPVIDPQLAPLAPNGGPTQTRALCRAPNVPDVACTAASPAIDKGINAVVPLTTDQRGAGFPRIVDNFPTNAADGTDIGAYEVPPQDFPNLTVTRADDRNNPTCAIGDCSLREALNAAGSNGTPDIITFNIPANSAGCAGTNCTIILTSSLVPAADAGVLTTIDGGTGANRVTLSGGAQFNHILSINNGANINVNNLNFTRGTSNFNGGSITVSGGGALTLSNSALYGNANNNPGGALRCESGCTANLTNVTISGNSSPNGGGISNAGTVTATNCTITNNGGGFGGGGISNNGTFNIRNTIIAGNNSAFSAQSDVFGVFASQGYNLIGKTDGTNGFTQTGDQTGTPAAPLDAKLAPLGNYGGKTLTHALLDGGAIPSPAINAGTATGAPSTDQRGAARVGVVDIGAFEVNNTANGGSFVAVLPEGSQIIPYLAQITANNGAFTYSVSSGTLPNGISLTTNVAPTAIVALSGTATQNGQFDFAITATNGANSNVTNFRVQILGPSSAGVSISGRVLSPDGNGVRNAIVQLTDLQGVTRIVRTGAFGYYRFEDVEVGQTYVVGVASKRYVFTPRTVSVSDELTELDFVAE